MQTPAIRYWGSGLLFLGLLWPSAAGQVCPSTWAEGLFRPDGPGVDGGVYALALYDDGTGPALYAAGNFTLIGGVHASNIARWDGNEWSPVGGGLSGSCYALIVHGDGLDRRLIAAGNFGEAGGRPAAAVAAWGGATWEEVGGGIQGTVTELIEYDGDLIAAGEFSAAGGQPAANVARWNGSAWSELDGGTNQRVMSLTIFDTGVGPALFVAGLFTEVGSDPIQASYIARWDGQGWSDVGSPATTGVYAMTVYDAGSGARLYAGGATYRILPSMALPGESWPNTSTAPFLT